MSAAALATTAISPDDSLVAATSVETPDSLGLSARLKEVQDACITLQNNDTEAKGEFEKRHARFITDASLLAFKLMQFEARPMLTKLVLENMREPLGATDSKMLGQIAALVVGRSVTDAKTGATSWKVPHKRDIRLGQFLRIFWGEPEKWQHEGLYDAILNHPGKTGGILEAAKKRGRVVRTDSEKRNNETAALRRPSLGKVPVPGINPKEGEWKLALVNVAYGGVEVRDIVKGQDALAARLAEEWCATNAAIAQASSVFNAQTPADDD